MRHASLDLHWFSPKDARRFLEASRAMGYLAQGSSRGQVRPTFEVAALEVPLDFRIDARALDSVPSGGSGVVEELAVAAAARRGEPIDEVWKAIARKQAEKLLDAPAAAALVAAEAGVDLGPFHGRIREELARLSRAPTSPAA